MTIGLDTETDAITEAVPVPDLISVSGHDGARTYTYAVTEPSGVEAAGAEQLIRYALATGWAGVNIPFDVLAILKWRPNLLPLVIDAYNAGRMHPVDSREKLIDIAEGLYFRRGTYGLAAIVERRCGMILDKSGDTWRLHYGRLRGLPLVAWPPEARAYAELDSVAHWRGWAAQEAFRAEHPTIDVFASEANEARGHLPLYDQSTTGIHTDPAQVAIVDRRLELEISELAGSCLSAGLVRVERKKGVATLVSSVKVASAMLEQHAAETGAPITRTARGASLCEDALIAARIPAGHPLDLFRRYAAARALRSKTIPSLRHPVIRTRYDELVESGRTSSSAPDEPWHGTNLQNQPREGGFRECLVPPPPDDYAPWGYYFGISDWSGVELVTLAETQREWYGSSALGDAIAAGRDCHSDLGAALIGVHPDAFDRHSPEGKKARQAAKPVNFGYPGGLGIARFIAMAIADYGVAFTESEARRAKRVWLETWPEMSDYFATIKSLIGSDGLITIVQPWSGRIRGGCTFPEACNTVFQGRAADAAKIALWWLWCARHDPSSPLHRVRQCLFVHDENVSAIPRDPRHVPYLGPKKDKPGQWNCGCRSCAALAEQDRLMVAAMAVVCPQTPIRVESGLAEKYHKD